MDEPISYDRHGYPIRAGDLLRLRHFVHYRNRRMCYIYKVVRETRKGLRCYAHANTSEAADDGYPVKTMIDNWYVEIIGGTATESETGLFFEREKSAPQARKGEWNG